MDTGFAAVLLPAKAVGAFSACFWFTAQGYMCTPERCRLQSTVMHVCMVTRHCTNVMVYKVQQVCGMSCDSYDAF